MEMWERSDFCNLGVLHVHVMTLSWVKTKAHPASCSPALEREQACICRRDEATFNMVLGLWSSL